MAFWGSGAGVAMLACTRVGAAHSVVFGGFSADALRDRILDAEAKVLVTADGGWRKGRANLLKPAADVALADTPSITGVVVVKRVDQPVEMVEGEREIRGAILDRCGFDACGGHPRRLDDPRESGPLGTSL